MSVREDSGPASSARKIRDLETDLHCRLYHHTSMSGGSREMSWKT